MCFEHFLKRVSLEAYDFCFCGVSYLQGCIGRAPRDGAAVDEEDVGDGGKAGVRDVGEGSVCVAVDNAWQGVVDSAPLKRNER
jgi:hypothetical protein